MGNFKEYDEDEDLDEDNFFNEVFGSTDRLEEIANDWEYDPENPDPDHFS